MPPVQERRPTDWSWDDLRVFLAAARAGSLAGAARRLGVDPSTASRRIAALEATFGVALFHRVRDGLELWPAGQELMAHAEAAEAAAFGFAQAAAGAAPGLAGTVRVAVPDAMDALLVVPELGAFRARWPEIRLEVVASAGLANLARREADLALRFVRPVAGDLVARRLVRMASGVWATPEAPADWIAGDEGEGAPDEIAWTARQVPDAAVVLRVNRLEARLAAVRAGLGRAALPDAVGRRVPGLVRLAVPEDPPPCDLWLVAHRRLYGVPRVRAVWDFLAELVARRVEPA